MYYKNYDQYQLTINRLIKKLPFGTNYSAFIYFYENNSDIKDRLMEMNKDKPYKTVSYEFHDSDIIFSDGDVYEIKSKLI